MKKITVLLFFGLSFHFGMAQFFDNEPNIQKITGFFNSYYDTGKDKLYIEVDKLNEEFLYVYSLSSGVGSNDIGLDRGQLGGGIIVKFEKFGNKLLMVQPNQKYRAITSNIEERKSVEEAFAKSVIFGFEIKKTHKNTYLIDATNFFMRDAHGVVNRLRRNNQGAYSLDKSKSAFNMERTKSFPKNSEFDVLLTFKGNPKGYHIRSVTPTASLVTVHQHHSFVELPDNNYKPRVFDPRSGAIHMSYLDYATSVTEPIVKRFVTRHRLEKLDPTAKLSEAKEPIVYYLDRGAPEPVRSALLEGARWWNQAFESIGFKNAFQVKMLPPEADPMDLRYNVIQWVHRSTRGWSYGGSIKDPRTGEILKGHVSLGSLRIRQDVLIAQALTAPYKYGDDHTNEVLEMALARIRQLSAHEVGHTIGFAHNFAASTNNRASVMDYPHPTIQLNNDGIDLSNAYATGIGDWDKVTVAYSYQQFEKNEKRELQKILEDASAKGLRFISDSDARAKGGAHAFAHLWDNGKSASEELDHTLKIRKKAMEHFSEDNIKTGEPYSVLEDVFVPLYFYHRYQAEATSKLIGGLDYNYAVKGDGQLVVETVDAETQKEALNVLLATIDIETLKIPERILKLFPPRAFGYGRTRESFKGKTGVAFDALSAAATASEMSLSLLLHPERASRLIQNKAMDKKQLGLVEVLDNLFKASIKRNHSGNYDVELQNTINFVVLNYVMNLAANKNQLPQVNAIANFKLNEIESWINGKNRKGIQEVYDQEYLRILRNFKKNPEKFKVNYAPKIPDGSPIGMGSILCN